MPRNHHRRGDAVVNFVVIFVVLITIALLAAYSAGWIRIQSQPDKATIEIETREMQQAGERAAEDTSRGSRHRREYATGLAQCGGGAA